MRKIVFFYHTGYCGMDGCGGAEYPDDVSDVELDEDAYQGAVEHAEMYGIYPTDYDVDVDAEDYEEPEYSGENIEGWWEEYDAKKHDGNRIGSGKFWPWEK